MNHPQLEVDIFQIVDDAVLKSNRTDGTGWEWGWADWQRDWMNATPSRNAYRCLPLTIANQTGWWIKNPVGFTARWNGSNAPGSIEFQYDVAGDFWKSWINNQFGEGIITWNTPFLFRTKPQGSRLLVCGPANYFKRNAHPLMAFIESDWMSMSFTMNWKVMTPGEPVRFDMVDPLFQAIPLLSNTGADLESASVRYQKLSDDADVHRTYTEWHLGRQKFHERKAQGEVKPDDWQKDYYQGRDALGRELADQHMTKVKSPRVQFIGSCAGWEKRSNGLSPSQAESHVMVPAEPAPQVKQSQRAAAGRSQAADSGAATATAAETPPDENGRTTVNAAMEASPAAAAVRRVDDDWRRWIAENLLLGASADTLQTIMTGQGISAEEAASEIALAAQSPYLSGADLLRNRLRKRDWQLATYRKINRLHPHSGEVPRRHRLSRQEFLEEYYSTNRPVIITGMMDDWPAMKKWNLDYFKQTLGDRVIEVQLNRTSGGHTEIDREKFVAKITFADFVDKVRSAGVSNDFYLTANNNPNNKNVLPELWDDIVQVPEYLDANNPHNGFFWLGPAGTITPFHHDLTNNFMAQVIGRKKLRLSPSWDIPLMDNFFHVYSRVDGRQTPPRPQPERDEAQILECILRPGEILFLPIAMMHYVEAIDISVTVSFTNFVFDNDFSSFYTTYHGV